MNSFVILALVLAPIVSYLMCKRFQTIGLIDKGWKDLVVMSAIAWLSLSGMSLLISQLGIAAKTMDTEIHSGQITKKDRVHDHYVETYECNCTTSNDGKRSCQTCRRDHYTVVWTAYSTIKDFEIKSLDSESRLVYLTPDPARYTKIQIGDPVAAEKWYKNYLLGIPKEFLYTDNLGATPELIAKIPSYPSVFDFYEINRVYDIGAGISPADVIKYNSQIANILRTMGAAKEVNIIMLLAKPDQQLLYAVREKWNGGKKNDVIIILGLEGDKISQAEVMTWNKNEKFKLVLRDQLLDAGTLNSATMDGIFNRISSDYVRPEMKDFEDLRIHIQPPLWSLILIYVIMFGTPFLIEYIATNKRKRFF